MNAPSSRNHYVPRFYLNRFCNDSGTLLRTHCRPDGALSEKRFVPKAVGYERDLLTIVCAGSAFPSGSPDYLEKQVLETIDNDGARALERILSFTPSDLGPRQRRHWATFVLSLLERNPKRIHTNDQLLIKSTRERLTDLRQHFGPVDTNDVDVFSLFDHEKLVRNLHRVQLAKQLTDERVIDYLATFRTVKIVIEPNPAFAFVTGDTPVLVNAGETWPIHFFSVSLNPWTLMFAQNTQTLPDTTVLLHYALLHNLMLFKQCSSVFSLDPLVDANGIRTRTAAQAHLKTTMARNRAA